jgi:FMN-dependent NADH-azoreductase
MGKLLYITANPKPVDESFSLRVGEHFLQAYQSAQPNDVIERIDLYKEEIPLIDQRVLGAWGKLANGQALTAEEQRVLARMEEILEQFISADKYVFVTPMWNLGFPPLLKAYIDNVVIARKTFAYTENGPVGLLANQGRKVLHIQGCGGVYSEGQAAAFDFTNPYLQGIMSFIGITDYAKIYVEGTNLFTDKQAILEKAFKQAEEAAAAMAKSAVAQHS